MKNGKQIRVSGHLLDSCAFYVLSAIFAITACTTSFSTKKDSSEDTVAQVENAATRLEIPTPTTRTESDPLVLVHYMPWYQAPPVDTGYGFHWHQGGAVFDPFSTLPDGRANIASHQYPLTGPYDSRDVSVLEYQAVLMKIAGIDGVIFDWYGIEDALDYKQIHESTLAMIEVLKRAGLKYAICYEDQSIGKMIEAKTLTKDGAVDAGKKVFAWMDQNWFSDDAYVKFEGRPLVLCFGPQYYLDKSQWDAIFAVCANRPWFVTLDEKVKTASDGSYNWSPMWASSAGNLSVTRLVTYLNDFYATQYTKNHLVATALPAFHDIYKEAGSGAGYGYLDYASGKVFELTLDAALRALPDVIQIQTWNDYGEGTIIEPTIERGYRELEVLQDTQKKYDKGFAWQYADLRAPIELRRVLTSGKATDAQKAAIAAAVKAAFTDDIDGFHVAVDSAGIKTDFSVRPILRDASSASASPGNSASPVFDPAGRKNLALAAPVVVSSKIYDFIGSKCVDGDTKTYWEGASSVWPNMVTVDLISSRQLSTLVLRLNPARIWNKRTQTFEILTSDDGKEFTTFTSSQDYVFDPATNANVVAVPLSVKARYVRLVFTANTGAKAGQIAELEVYGE